MGDQSAKAIYKHMYAQLTDSQKRTLEQQYDIGDKPSMHWCHLVAFCLLNGTDTDPQDKDNLAAGTAQCNQNMKLYEDVFQRHLKDGSLDRLELWGEAEVTDDTDLAVAKNITLNIKAYANGTNYSTELSFPALSTQKENKIASQAFDAMHQAALRLS